MFTKTYYTVGGLRNERKNMVKRILSFIAVLGVLSLTALPALASTQPQVQAAYSGNWSGYVSSSGTYTGVGATWTVPTATASGSLSADATWVGIGGITTNDLIQVGTQAVFQSGSTQPSYSAWYEMLPASNVPISMTISAGDSVTASVAQQSAGNWLVAFRDNTTGQSYQTNLTYSSSLSSAEWIEEMPSLSSGNSFIPLDNFGTVSFSGTWATQNGSNVGIAASGSPTALTMYNPGGSVLATPSALGSDGASFSVTRTSAAATPVGILPFGSGFGSGTGTGRRVHRVGVGVSGFGRGFRRSTTSGSTPAGNATPTSSGTGFGGFGSWFTNIPGGTSAFSIPTITLNGVPLTLPPQQEQQGQPTTYNLGNGWTVTFGSLRFR